MTRDQFVAVITKIDREEYPWKHCLNYLLDSDAEQRQEIESLSSLLDVANKGLLKYEREIERLRGWLRQAISVANGLTNYVEDRPGLRDAERQLQKLEEQIKKTSAKEPPCDTSSS